MAILVISKATIDFVFLRVKSAIFASFILIS